MLVGGTENICVVIQELPCNLDSSSEPEPELMHINICLQLTVRKAEALIGGFPLPGPTWHSYLASSPFVAFTTWSQGYINELTMHTVSRLSSSVSQNISPHLKIESAVSIIAKDEVAIKARQVSVKT